MIQETYQSMQAKNVDKASSYTYLISSCIAEQKNSIYIMIMNLFSNKPYQALLIAISYTYSSSPQLTVITST